MKNATTNELMLILSCNILKMAKHDNEFINKQKHDIENLNINDDVKKECLNILNSIQ